MKTNMLSDNRQIKAITRREEQIVNKYAVECITSVMVIITLVLILNLMDIFLVDRKAVIKCFLICFAVYIIGILIYEMNDISKSWMKYFILVWATIIVTVVSTTLTYHAVLGYLFPIVYTSMYCSKRMMVCSYLLTVVSIVVSVFVGYSVGICDANMMLLPGKIMAEYVGEDNTLLLTHINNKIVWSLSLFFILPRCMICAAFSLVCNNISRIISANIRYAQHMENVAEIDGMTGLYNRSKYLNMMTEIYQKEERISVIFWDINYLKKINDTLGHEAGDRLILAVAECIKSITDNGSASYRIGGDEFVMIIPDGNEESAKNKEEEWEKTINEMNEKYEFDISVSTGYASGKGEELENVIALADKMMYENKRKEHNRL